MVIHDLKIEPQYFNAVCEGLKKFEIRKNDRNYKNHDLLLLKEYEKGEYTGQEVLRQISFITDYEQKDGFVVMSLKSVPTSFKEYIKMNKKEQEVFKIVVTHTYLYGFVNREITNTLMEIIETLIGEHGLTEYEKCFYRNYWNES